MSGARLRACAPELCAAACALALLLPGLGTLPGFHGDEAWMLRRAKEIAGGLRPLDGMNAYTGSLHLYALWSIFEGFGYRLEVLRATAALLAAATAALVVRVARLPLFGGASPGWVAALLVSSPAFLLSSRFAIETTVLLPLLDLAGLLLVAHACAATGGRRAVQAVAGGALIGIATYIHVLAAAPAAAAALVFLVLAPRRALREPALWLAAAGFLLGFAPRWLALLTGAGSETWHGRFAKIGSADFTRDFGPLTGVLADLLDGRLLYQRYAGGSALPVPPYASGALVLLAALRFAAPGVARPGRREAALALFLVLLAILVVVLSPGLSTRYFTFALLCAPLLFATLAQPLLTAPSARTRRLARGLLAAVVALGLFYVTTNYWIAFARSGGTSSVFWIGERLLDTSNHFLRTDRLYAQLVERGVDTVLAKDFIAWPLSAYDLERGALRFVEFPPRDLPPLEPLRAAGSAAVIYYAGAEVFDNRPWQPPEGDVLRVGPLTLRRDASFDPHFVVFVREAEPRAE